MDLAAARRICSPAQLNLVRLFEGYGDPVQDTCPPPLLGLSTGLRHKNDIRMFVVSFEAGLSAAETCLKLSRLDVIHMRF